MFRKDNLYLCIYKVVMCIYVYDILYIYVYYILYIHIYVCVCVYIYIYMHVGRHVILYIHTFLKFCSSISLLHPPPACNWCQIIRRHYSLVVFDFTNWWIFKKSHWDKTIIMSRPSTISHIHVAFQVPDDICTVFCFIR